jgi:hypothetical protein
MPYINEKEREELDDAIDNLILAIRNNFTNQSTGLKNYLGRINYCFSRVICGVMGDVSYPKIAMITGVLENIKQEFYRRVASPYEDKKILENADIKEYKRSF